MILDSFENVAFNSLRVPVAFATTVLAEAVTGRLRPPTLIASVLLAAGRFTLARWFWKAGIRRYSGASA